MPCWWSGQERSRRDGNDRRFGAHADAFVSPRVFVLLFACINSTTHNSELYNSQ